MALICRMDCGGIAWRTEAICRMLRPASVLLIDSRSFNGYEVQQFPERFAEYDCMITKGFPTDEECRAFLDGLTHVLTCETPYNRELYIEARRRVIKTYEQYNFEFQDALIKPELAQPTMFLAPSLWNIDVMRSRFGNRVVHIPPPTSTRLRPASASQPPAQR